MSNANRLRIIFVGLITLLACRAPLARGQNADDVVRIDTSLIQLNIGVADRQGRPITDLQPNNFKVYEDGALQSLTSFESTTTPLSLALLLDMSGSTLGFRQNLKLAASRFIDALAPEDRVAVIGFNERAELLTTFTVDRNKIAWAIERAEGRG